VLALLAEIPKSFAPAVDAEFEVFTTAGLLHEEKVGVSCPMVGSAGPLAPEQEENSIAFELLSND
jgi:hypothetical protein